MGEELMSAFGLQVLLSNHCEWIGMSLTRCGSLRQSCSTFRVCRISRWRFGGVRRKPLAKALVCMWLYSIHLTLKHNFPMYMASKLKEADEENSDYAKTPMTMQ